MRKKLDWGFKFTNCSYVISSWLFGKFSWKKKVKTKQKESVLLSSEILVVWKNEIKTPSIWSIFGNFRFNRTEPDMEKNFVFRRGLFRCHNDDFTLAAHLRKDNRSRILKFKNAIASWRTFRNCRKLENEFLTLPFFLPLLLDGPIFFFGNALFLPLLLLLWKFMGFADNPHSACSPSDAKTSLVKRAAAKVERNKKTHIHRMFN